VWGANEWGGSPLVYQECISNWEAVLAELHFTTAPEGEEPYKVGDKVEVYCDHDKKEERVRGWLIGTVVQVDSKMISVQFQENVYLTDGWMVPDHVLWCPKESTNVRHARKRRRSHVRSK
jgi:hypothetical protein